MLTAVKPAFSSYKQGKDCTATNNLDTGEGLRGGWSGLWASDLKE